VPKGKAYLSRDPFARKRGRGAKGGDVPPSCAAPRSRINGGRGAKGGYARAVLRSHALFARERGGGRGRKWGGLIPPGPAFACPFARERGQKGEKGGVPFPGGTEGGVTRPLCPFLAEEGEGAQRRGQKKGGVARHMGGRETLHALRVAYTYVPLFVLYLLHTYRSRKILDKNKLCL